METKDIVLVAVLLVLVAEVTYILSKLPRTTIKSKKNPILVDTSVIMDGRIVAIAKTGFIGGTLVVPRSVIGELQFLADNADADKRARARMGLDVIAELQALPNVVIEILQDGSKAEEGVDERLLTLAKQHQASICTVDYNLNKVATVEGIVVLNINELAQSLRMAHLPGEQMMIDIVQKGQDSHQGVGYLADGTMVVVEQANRLIGKTAHVEVVRSLQTAAGKMMFAKPIGEKPIEARTQTRQKPLRGTAASTKPENKPARAERANGRRQPSNADKPSLANNQRKTTATSNPRPRTTKRPSSAAREAALIDLVEKQSN